ncbi:hypothetical protein [Streptomonospora litoralis]|uniref:Uncharacterized protein n=1 Tax=Streptomonospora litoralis TaxID=2498135 RepID=A0A4P6Q7C1_9ACTN|nr:hypothetical protein [Streptomonospora litoralis]QBI56270.1 hypothetical protein EKD16_22585 [Streptomonospora litoralis]
MRLVETRGEDARAALKTFADEIARGRRLQTPPGAPVHEFAADLPEHPVFEIVREAPGSR